jgi:ABC-2 type transport system ATP-binding protein
MFFFSRRRRTKEVLQLVDLWDVRKRTAGKLSGGMQRRLELACALVHDPALLFLDEPTAGIDPLLRAKVWEELHRLRADGRTMIVTTQYVNEAESCDTVALIANGRLLALATPDDLRREAVGGDVVVVETAALFDGEQLTDLPFVRHVRQDGSRQLTVVVDDAGTALPDVVEAVRSRGGEVVSAREERPSFDDVFAALVKRDEQTRAAADAGTGEKDDVAPNAAAPETPDGVVGETDTDEPILTPPTPEPLAPTGEPAIPVAEEADWREADGSIASATPVEPALAGPDADRERPR